MCFVCEVILIMIRKGNCVLLCILGGVIFNMYVMLIVRFKMFSEVKEKGMVVVFRFIVFTFEYVGVFVFFKFKDIFCKVWVEGMVFGRVLFLEVFFLEDVFWERMRVKWDVFFFFWNLGKFLKRK